MRFRDLVNHEAHDDFGGISRSKTGRCIECLGPTQRLAPILAGGAHWFLHYTCDQRFRALHVGREVK